MARTKRKQNPIIPEAEARQAVEEDEIIINYQLSIINLDADW